MTEAEIVAQFTTMGITGPELLKVGGATFGLVLAAFFFGWLIGVAVKLIKKIG